MSDPLYEFQQSRPMNRNQGSQHLQSANSGSTLNNRNLKSMSQTATKREYLFSAKTRDTPIGHDIKKVRSPQTQSMAAVNIRNLLKQGDQLMKRKNRLQSAITAKTYKSKPRTLETVDTIPEYHTGQNLFVGNPGNATVGNLNTITGTGSPHQIQRVTKGIRDSLQESDLQSSMILHDQYSEMMQKRPQTSKLGRKRDTLSKPKFKIKHNLNVKSNFLSTNTLKSNQDSERKMSKQQSYEMAPNMPNPGLDIRSHNSTNQFQSLNYNAPLISEQNIENDSQQMVDYYDQQQNTKFETIQSGTQDLYNKDQISDYDKFKNVKRFLNQSHVSLKYVRNLADKIPPSQRHSDFNTSQTNLSQESRGIKMTRHTINNKYNQTLIPAFGEEGSSLHRLGKYGVGFVKQNPSHYTSQYDQMSDGISINQNHKSRQRIKAHLQSHQNRLKNQSKNRPPRHNLNVTGVGSNIGSMKSKSGNNTALLSDTMYINTNSVISSAKNSVTNRNLSGKNMALKQGHERQKNISQSKNIINDLQIKKDDQQYKSYVKNVNTLNQMKATFKDIYPSLLQNERESHDNGKRKKKLATIIIDYQNQINEYVNNWGIQNIQARQKEQQKRRASHNTVNNSGQYQPMRKPPLHISTGRTNQGAMSLDHESPENDDIYYGQAVDLGLQTQQFQDYSFNQFQQNQAQGRYQKAMLIEEEIK